MRLKINRHKQQKHVRLVAREADYPAQQEKWHPRSPLYDPLGRQLAQTKRATKTIYTVLSDRDTGQKTTWLFKKCRNRLERRNQWSGSKQEKAFLKIGHRHDTWRNTSSRLRVRIPVISTQREIMSDVAIRQIRNRCTNWTSLNTFSKLSKRRRVLQGSENSTSSRAWVISELSGSPYLFRTACAKRFA